MAASERRAQILSCARSLFGRRGVHLTSIADICREAGIGRGTLYQYFEGKDAVFLAVMEDLAARVAAVIEARQGVAAVPGAAHAPPELITAFCASRLRDLLDAVFVDEAGLRLLLRDARGLDGAVDALIRRVDAVVLGALVEDLRAAERLGVIACPDVERTALFVLGGVEKMVLGALERDEPVDLEGVVATAVRLQLFGLLTDTARARGASPPA